MTPPPPPFLLSLAFFLIFVAAAAAAVTTSPKNPLILTLHPKNHTTDGNFSSSSSRIDQDMSRRRWLKNRSIRQEKSLAIPFGLQNIISEYVIVASIGEPESTYTFQVDTGSGLSWLQCIPCVSCFEQFNAIYDPSQSQAGSVVMWTDPLCQSLKEYETYQGEHGECRYVVKYGDQSRTDGYLRLDSITLNGDDDNHQDAWYSQTIPIGCGVNQSEHFSGEGPTGILGLSNATYSLVSALHLVSFSYCLVAPINGYDIEASSTLVLNDTAPPLGDPNTIFIDLLSVTSESFLYVNLTEISVNDILVPIPDGTFTVRPDNGEGGVILDSGTFYTYLTEAAYEPLKNLFQQETAAPTTEDPRVNPTLPFELCFDRIGDLGQSNPYPTMTLYFDENIPVPLRLENYIQFNVSGFPFIDCFTIFREQQGEMMSIIGIAQQYGSRFFFDLDYDFIAIKPNQC